MKLTLERAEEILKKHTTEEHLFTHALAVSSAMGAMRSTSEKIPNTGGP